MRKSSEQICQGLSRKFKKLIRNGDKSSLFRIFMKTVVTPTLKKWKDGGFLHIKNGLLHLPCERTVEIRPNDVDENINKNRTVNATEVRRFRHLDD